MTKLSPTLKHYFVASVALSFVAVLSYMGWRIKATEDRLDTVARNLIRARHQIEVLEVHNERNTKSIVELVEVLLEDR